MNVGGEWYYDDYAPGRGVATWASTADDAAGGGDCGTADQRAGAGRGRADPELQDGMPPVQARRHPADERRQSLELFHERAGSPAAKRAELSGWPACSLA